MQNSVSSLRYLKITVAERERARGRARGVNNEPVLQTVPQWSVGESGLTLSPHGSRQKPIHPEEREGVSERLMGPDPRSPRLGASLPKPAMCVRYSLPRNHYPKP